MRVVLLFVVTVNFFLLVSCKKYGAANPAFFIKASHVSVKTNSLNISGSNKITDLWLYVDKQFIGVYPVGNLMPVPNPSNGKIRIDVLAGIENNGISSTRIPLNLYALFTLDTLVKNGTTISRSFAFEYLPTVVFPWVENFDLPGFQLINSSGSAASFTLASAAESFEGKSMKLEIPSTHADDIAQVESADYYTLPTSNSDVYLEMDYKCNAPVYIGLVGNTDPTKKALMQLNPTITDTKNAWNKIYIQLSTMVSIEPVSSKYKVYFQIIKNSEYPNPQLFLDNLKFVYNP
ncbi:MAG: hypothetical protein KF900_05060 [Bacteroidetes bacterium]|nr:hypothetical protein [Bacteroidota bacterium]